MSTFLKKGEVTLENGGYITSKDGSPVSNVEFEVAQKHAEYVVTLANLAKGKDFKGKKADDINELKAQVMKQLSEKETIEFVKGPKKVKRPTTEALKEEALAFLNFETEKDNTEKINKFLQQFSIINEFETFGLFFNPKISKLNKIYTMKEVVAAVSSMIDNLD
jgi:hypothetical protein